MKNNTNNAPPFHLMLSNERGEPIVDPIAQESTEQLDNPSIKARQGGLAYEDFSGDAQDLEEQRWDVIYPEGEGRLLEAIDELRKFRQDEQDAEVRTFAVRPNMSEDATQNWYEEEFTPKESEDRGRYVLLLGDFDKISIAFQRRLHANKRLVGRLAFDSLDDYRSYAKRAIKDPPSQQPRTHFCTSRHGSQGAIYDGYNTLVKPMMERITKQLEREKKNKKKRFETRELVDIDEHEKIDKEEFLEAIAEGVGDTLFTLSHGRAGDTSWELKERKQNQGALRFENYLTAQDIKNRPLLPGGAWFMFACLGLGTPSTSVYDPWCKKIWPNYESHMKSIASPGGSFVADLPKQALANPEGPLAIFGHIDLAFEYSYRRNDTAKPLAFYEILKDLVKGRRIGSTMQMFQNEKEATDYTLLRNYIQRDESDAAPDSDKSRGQLVLRHHDLGGWMLLGDPAARIRKRP